MHRFVSHLIVTLLFVALAGVSPVRAELPSAVGFKAWLETVRPAAAAIGVSSKTFDAATKGLTPDFKIPDLVLDGKPKVDNSGQAEFTKTARDYIAKPYMESLAAQGKAFYQKYKPAIDAIEAKTGVDRYILVAIWGRETAYGTHVLPHDAIQVLATLAYAGRRKEMFFQEFLNALKMLEDGIPRSDMRSSWAGAVGLTQFMPTEFDKYASDGDGDGRRDIWRSVPDALASAAAQLAGKGWVRGVTWGYETVIGAGGDCSLEGPPGERKISEWAALGFRRTGRGRFSDAHMGQNAYLMSPAGTYGPAFLVTDNFKVIRLYNTSDLYALFVGHLADRIAGGGDFDTPWGNSQHPRTRTVHDIQQGLQALGYPMDKLDGKIGSNTRRQIGIFQKKQGLKIDCWPSDAVLADVSRAAR